MADMLAPLNWDMPTPPPQAPGAAAAVAPSPAPIKEKASREAFKWPTPPFASYPAPTEQTDTLPCQIVPGPELKVTSVRLTFFVPENSVAHLQMPSARTTVPLRFDQFKALTLTTPLLPLPLPLSDPHADLLRHRESSPYTVQLAGGGEMQGQTVGHVETDFGLFLFPPCDDDGSVKRTSSGERVRELRDRPKLGDLLVEQHHATWEQVTDAMDLQDECAARRSRHPGDGRSSCPSSCSRRSRRRQDADGAHRRSLLRWAWSPGAAQGSAGPQQLDRSVPLGEILVRSGVVSRDDLQTALARKMGYPLVTSTPFRPKRMRCASSTTVAARLRGCPADSRGPPRRGPRRSVASRRARRDRVQRRHEGGAGAGPRPVDRDGAARRLREGGLGRTSRKNDDLAPIRTT